MLRRIFGGSQKRKESVGERAVHLTKEFFGRSPSIPMQAHTFTELFAFVFLNADVFAAMKHPDIRDSVCQSLSHAFSQELGKTFSVTYGEEYINALNTRVREYGSLIQEGSRPSDVFERFSFHFLQTNAAGEFNGPNTRLYIEGAFDAMSKKQELAVFCSTSVPEFVKRIPRLM